MAARGEPNDKFLSPELALVDPELRSRALAIGRTPADTWSSTPRRSRPSRAYPPLPILHEVSVPANDPDVSEATRRLNELGELEPVAQPRRSAKALSLAFATLAWATLALVLAELHPWRL
jgi:hypothetical protein